jgi:invasion protein IalB
MMKYVISAAMALAALGSAHAGVTVCQGRSCTVVSGSSAHQMSQEEVTEHFRSKSRQQLWNVECDLAKEPNVCRSLVQSLTNQFLGR